ncbi:MAG: glycosyltransferase family 4 protein [Bryobacteraceae bacterium]|nr:glycosyltransferase family 4 protein [Bryobacteraceae bacterium]
MRILHVDTGRELRGGQIQAMLLVRGLLAAGHDCRLYAPPESPLHQQDLPTAPLSSLRRHAHGADLLHAHDSRAHSYCLFLGARVVVARRVAFGRRPNFLSRWKYGRVDRFLAVSEYVRQLLIQEGIAGERIAVVPDGTPLLPESSHAPGRIITLASADPRKGGALMRETAALLGRGVHFSTDLTQDLATASLFLYATDMEGLGSAALLAQSAGVPVVASRVGGLPEAVADGVTGLLVDQSAAAFAQAVDALLADPDRLARMGQAGRERVKAHFSIDRLIARTLEEYEIALA